MVAILCEERLALTVIRPEALVYGHFPTGSQAWNNSTVRLQIKSLDEAGRFVGLASTYGNVDLGGDVVEPGAFQKTITDRGGEVPLLFAHDSRQPIGLA